jgi:hypothetical protein
MRRWVVIAAACVGVFVLVGALQPIPCAYEDKHPAKASEADTHGSQVAAPSNAQRVAGAAAPESVAEQSQYPRCNPGAGFLAHWGLRVAEDPLALFTLLLWLATARLVADAKASSRQDLRAYISADFGQAFYQDAHHFFGSAPTLFNSGKTPAMNLAYWCKAAILPTILPRGYQFEKGTPIVTDVGMSPRHNYVVRANIGVFRAPEAVAEILRGDPVRLYVWGVVKYEDVFGEEHTTEFCHNFFFTPIKGELNHWAHSGAYNPTHNKAT